MESETLLSTEKPLVLLLCFSLNIKCRLFSDKNASIAASTLIHPSTKDRTECHNLEILLVYLISLLVWTIFLLPVQYNKVQLLREQKLLSWLVVQIKICPVAQPQKLLSEERIRMGFQIARLKQVSVSDIKVQHRESLGRVQNV